MLEWSSSIYKWGQPSKDRDMEHVDLSWLTTWKKLTLRVPEALVEVKIVKWHCSSLQWVRCRVKPLSQSPKGRFFAGWELL